jgi:hypothetical protein
VTPVWRCSHSRAESPACSQTGSIPPMDVYSVRYHDAIYIKGLRGRNRHTAQRPSTTIFRPQNSAPEQCSQAGQNSPHSNSYHLNTLSLPVRDSFLSELDKGKSSGCVNIL